MNSKNLYDWLFSSIDDIIDCDFSYFEEEKEIVKNNRKRSFEVVNDFGESRRDNSQ